MHILSIETSCDETALSVLRADGDFPNATYTVLGNALFSQIDIHKEYGGVFPALAKREHIKTILPLCLRALTDAGLLRRRENSTVASLEVTETLTDILNREGELAGALADFFETYEKPDIDLIAVTAGPGLEPALWVGVNFAKALAFLFDIPVVPVNHMEGHVLASVFDGTILKEVRFPALALLISGGHTEFVLMQNWQRYEKIGQTRDDAVGEAFDKVARLLGLPYPGGPEISRLADEGRKKELPLFAPLPRPMLDSGDLDLSFSGIKTAVRYAVADKTLTDDERCSVAREFEDAVTEVLLAKTKRAVDAHNIQSLILGGGVSANRFIRDRFTAFFTSEYPDLLLHIPDPKLTTDNSIMIALAGHARKGEALSFEEARDLRAEGNRSIA